MAMNWFDPSGMGGGSGAPAPTNQQPFDPTNPNMSAAPWAGNPGQPVGPGGMAVAPGTGTTPSGGPPVAPDAGSPSKGFNYDPSQKPGTNALNYLGTQLSSLFNGNKPQVAQNGSVSGSPQAGGLAGSGLTQGEGKNQGGLMKFAGSIGEDMG